MSKQIPVISKEGETIYISEEAACTSKYLATVLKDEPDCNRIMTNIPAKALKIAKEFRLSCVFSLCIVEYHVNKPMAPVPKPLKDYQNFRNNIEDVFDSNLVIGLNRDDTFDLLYTAQVLQNEPLVSLWYVFFHMFTYSAAYTASLINGKNVNELREFFQVEDDLTEEEKLQIEKENACFRI